MLSSKPSKPVPPITVPIDRNYHLNNGHNIVYGLAPEYGGVFDPVFSGLLEGFPQVHLDFTHCEHIQNLR